MSKSIVKDDTSILIPEGIYELAVLHYETRIIFGRKVILWFSVVSPKKYAGLIIPCYYNVTKHIGPQMVGGKFEVGRNRKFVRDYLNVFGDVEELSEIDIDNYIGKTVLGKVVTVTQGSQKEKIPNCLQYSRVSDLIELKDEPVQASLEAEQNGDWTKEVTFGDAADNDMLY